MRRARVKIPNEPKRSALFNGLTFSGCANRGGSTWKQSNGTSAAPVDEVYRTCRIDDRGPTLALLLDAVVFRIQRDPERLPFTGLWHGHAGVNEHLDRFGAEGEIPRFEPGGRRRVHVARPGRHALAPQRQRARDRTHQDRLLDDPRRQSRGIPSGTRFQLWPRTLRLRAAESRRAAGRGERNDACPFAATNPRVPWTTRTES